MTQQKHWLFELPVSLDPSRKADYINEKSFSSLGNGNPYGWIGETEWELPTTPTSRQSCPQAASTTMLRCTGKTPKVCPEIPNLLCMKAVGNIPFEYISSIKKDKTTGLIVVHKRLRNHTQKFIPGVENSLITFISNLTQFGLPIESIFTLGSYLCRCVSKTNTLSNHSFGDAIDIAGLRWKQAGVSSISSRETIVYNFRDSHERFLLRRINACLRLSFSTVIDYHRKDHQDHFHCDMNRGRGRNPLQKSNLVFVQEALNVMMRSNLPENGEFNTATKQVLLAFCRSINFRDLNENSFKNTSTLNSVFDTLFRVIASTAS
jgi:Extensin-like protein C-terminus